VFVLFTWESEVYASMADLGLTQEVGTR